MKKLLKILKYSAYTVISFLLIDLAVVGFFSVYRPPIQKADAIIVLGAAINTPALYNRTLEGLELYNRGDADVLVLSGGVDYPKSIPEAEYMKNVILKQGENQSANHPPLTPPVTTSTPLGVTLSETEWVKGGETAGVPNLILEENSNSTYENIKNSKKLIPQAHSLIIVSDDFHLARAVLMAKRLGFGPLYWSSPKPAYYSTPELAFYFMREIFAMIDYIPKFIFG